MSLCSVFKYFCRARAEKLERSKASYACLGRVVRDGGFKVCLMARLSALPSHCACLWLLVGCDPMGLIFLSYHCSLRHLWYEYFRIYPGRLLVTTEAIPHRLRRRSVHYTALH